MANNEIQALIASFAAQLESLAKKAAIEQVIASLGGAAAPARGGPGRPAGATKAAPQRGGSPSAEQLVSYVKSNPGSRADQIAKALGTTPDKMRATMQGLMDRKKVKRSGVRRGTTYRVA